MYTTINGIKFNVKKEMTQDEIKKFIHLKTGADVDKIIIYNNYIGFFNCIDTTNLSIEKSRDPTLKNVNFTNNKKFNTSEEKSKTTKICEENVFREYGVPDEVFYLIETSIEFLDYKTGCIIKDKKFPLFLDSFDGKKSAFIFKHLLCEEDEMEEVVKEPENVDIDSFIKIMENGSDVTDKEKQLICDNMREIVDKKFNKK